MVRNRAGRAGKPQPGDIYNELAQRIIGQSGPLEAIAPYVQMERAGLAPEGRPLGNFLLLGPTGAGKTHTVEALAEVLHGNPKKLLRIDCGEYQMDHEVAKLIGAPPGYLGHRETAPMISQSKLTAVTSERCALSLVLFDEVEKAAPSLTRLLLGILDRGVLRLGDNTSVNLDKAMIFMTSNLGARRMSDEIRPRFGFGRNGTPGSVSSGRFGGIGMAAARKAFPPEFVNRLDAVLTYQPLSRESVEIILDQQLRGLQCHIDRRLGYRAFRLRVQSDARRFLLDRGWSPEFGARELKRAIHRYVVQQLSAHIAERPVDPGATVFVSLDASGAGLEFRRRKRGAPSRRAR